MNSSGIKRGLATTAVTALAVAGLPLIASSASAVSGDTMSFLSEGPIRDGNAAGGSVIIKSSSMNIDPEAIYVGKADYSGAKAIVDEEIEIQSTAFDVDVLSFELLDGNPNKADIQKFADGFYHYEMVTAVTLGSASKATFGVFEDGDGNKIANASDAKTVVEVTPTGAPDTIAISPDTNTTATGVESPKYTVTVKDANGKVTQLQGDEGFTPAATGVTFEGDLDASTMGDGMASFTATSATGGTKTIKVSGNDEGETPATITANATLKVIEQAEIDEDEFDFVTGADDWPAAKETFGGNIRVRVDQGAVTFEFASLDGDDEGTAPDDANKVVLLTLASEDVKFGGETEKTYSVVLDSNGKGSLTVNPTGIVDGAEFTFTSPSMDDEITTVTFERAAAETVASDAEVYVTKVGSPTSVTVSVTDQFGNPVGAPAQVQIVRDGIRNTGATSRQTVNSAGEATFALADAGTLPGTESLDIRLFADQFDPEPRTFEDATAIRYTADGLGDPFVVTGASDDASETVITPIYDAIASDGDSAEITITGGTSGTPAKVTVDNGALVLTGTETKLSQGDASDSITLDGSESFTVIGTKTGVVTVTIENAGRTETVQLTVEQPEDAEELAATARNVDLEGPETVNAGSVATYVATVTDAFGNTVAGVPAKNLAFSVSGPANLQNADTATDSDGQFEQGVLLTDNANSSITVKVTGTNDTGDGAVVTQFGKAANQYSVAKDAPGLSASDPSKSVTSEVKNIAQLEKAVEDAQKALDEAKAELASAQAELDVAQAELAIAQANVDSLTAKKQSLRQKLNKAKDKGNKQKAKTTRKKLRAVKRNLRAAEDNVTLAQAKVDARSTVVELRQDQVDAAQADLDEAEANLEEAQS